MTGTRARTNGGSRRGTRERSPRSVAARTTRPSAVTDLGAEFVAGLAARDFPRLRGTLAPDARLRALIPPGPVEVTGADAVAAKFGTWFGSAERLELVRADGDVVADRLHVTYRLRVKRPDDGWKLVEQHLLCTVDQGRIAALDLLCSGFRPDPPGSFPG